MKNTTRLKYSALMLSIATANGVAVASDKFNVDPSIAQKMVDALQESSAFLNKLICSQLMSWKVKQLA